MFYYFRFVNVCRSDLLRLAFKAIIHLLFQVLASVQWSMSDLNLDPGLRYPGIHLVIRFEHYALIRFSSGDQQFDIYLLAYCWLFGLYGIIFYRHYKLLRGDTLYEWYVLNPHVRQFYYYEKTSKTSEKFQQIFTEFLYYTNQIKNHNNRVLT